MSKKGTEFGVNKVETLGMHCTKSGCWVLTPTGAGAPEELARFGVIEEGAKALPAGHLGRRQVVLFPHLPGLLVPHCFF